MVADSLAALATHLRTLPGVRAKAEIGLVSQVLGGADWYAGPGDDGAVLPGGPGEVVVCGEAMLPQFVAADPYGAGVAAVLANVNDLAAMGARPTALVDTVVAAPEVAREVLRGLRWAGERYRVPIVGGHLTTTTGSPAVSAFGVGRATRVLSALHARPGHALVVAACTEGRMREDFPFFPSFDERGERLADDVRLLAVLAEAGDVVAAKDVSMAGLVGSLAMLLEPGRLGVVVDLDALPVPTDVEPADWLACFPCFGFLLVVPEDRIEGCTGAFHGRGLAASVVGRINDSGRVELRRGQQQALVFDLAQEGITRLRA